MLASGRAIVRGVIRRGRVCLTPLKCAAVLGLILPQLLPSLVNAAPHNLDEMFARKERMASVTWPASALENKSSYVWQPETLQFTDATTGHEVWRLSNTPGLATYFNNTLSSSPWSADGKRLAFVSQRETGAYSKGTSPADSTIWAISSADGTYLRALLDVPSRQYWPTITPEFHWSPFEPDVFFELGNPKWGITYARSTLYKTTVGDLEDNTLALLTLPTKDFSRFALQKSVSSDGKKVIVLSSDESWLFPCTVYPTQSIGLDVSTGYTSNRPHGNSLEERTYWGDTPDSFNSFHGFRTLGDGQWYQVMPSGSSTFWKFKTVGTAPDGGSTYLHDITHDASGEYDWGGESVVLNSTSNTASANDPWCDNTVTECPGYMSHVTPDRWGRHFLFSSVRATPIGPGVYDTSAHRWVVKTFGGGVQHSDWSAWSDWNASSSGAIGGDYLKDSIYTQKFDDASSQIKIFSPYTLYNNGGAYAGASSEYVALARPTQSPDGTKVTVHSTFLNAKTGSYDDAPDIYWAVAYYPYPPEITSSSLSGGQVVLSWDFRHTTASPRTYTKRGWPDESSDNPPAPRELKGFRLWVSSDGAEFSPVLGTTPYLNWGGQWSQTTWSRAIAQEPGTTRYYAVTSVEHSGLESRALSNILKVTIDETGAPTENTFFSAYPADPGGVAPFKTQRPPAPDNFTYSRDATVASTYHLSWEEPPQIHETIRYYNIYYSAVGAPSIGQNTRIASVPKGTTSFLDWNAVAGSEGYYLITSVDTQGNEGAVAAPQSPVAQ